jgi:hypothetical protein
MKVSITGVEVSAATFRCDGTALPPSTYRFEIRRWEGPRSILSLPGFPISIYNSFEDDGGKKAMNKLVDRSNRFWGFALSRYFSTVTLDRFS